jgi:drug/metabolite transporter (DMT)-like permease
LKSWKAELLLFFVTFVWGATFIFTKLGLEFSNPSVYLIIRFSIALTISLALFGKQIFKINREVLKQGLILGVFFGVGFLLQTYGLKMTTVSKSAFITGITVVVTPFVYWAIVRKSIGIWPKIGVLISIPGLWLFTNPNLANPNMGDILTLISTLCWALYITYMDIFTKGRQEFRETIQLVAMQFVAATPLAVIMALLFEPDNLKIEFSPVLIYSLLYNGILASFVLTLIHTSVQRFTSPVKAALIFSLEPLIATFLAVMFMKEDLGYRELIGAFILISGVLTSELGAMIAEKNHNKDNPLKV